MLVQCGLKNVCFGTRPEEVFDMQKDRVQLPRPNVSAHQVTVVTARYVNMQSCCIIKAWVHKFYMQIN